MILKEAIAEKKEADAQALEALAGQDPAGELV